MNVNLRAIVSAVVFGGSILIAGCSDDSNPSSPTPPVVAPEPPAPGPGPTASPTPPGGVETVSFLGIVRDVQGSNLYVTGRYVVVTNETSFIHEDGSPWSLGAVQVGDHVRVKGVVGSDGSVTAQRITALN